MATGWGLELGWDVVGGCGGPLKKSFGVEKVLGGGGGGGVGGGGGGGGGGVMGSEQEGREAIQKLNPSLPPYVYAMGLYATSATRVSTVMFRRMPPKIW